MNGTRHGTKNNLFFGFDLSRPLKKLGLFFLCALSGCASSASDMVFFTPEGNGIPKLGVAEAICYPKEKSFSKDGEFPVIIMVANLYYYIHSDGSEQLVCGSKEHPGYDFQSITISCYDQFGANVAAYEVPMEEYNKAENGISIGDVGERPITRKDFSLCYDFDLASLLPVAYSGVISFRVAYVEPKEEGEFRTFGKLFSFSQCERGELGISLKGFDWDYFG